jgi:hypothetical protein
VEHRIAVPKLLQGTLGPKIQKSKSSTKSGLCGVKVNPKVPPVLILIFNHKLLFSPKPQAFPGDISCIPIPVAVNPDKLAFPQIKIALTQSFCADKLNVNKKAIIDNLLDNLLINKLILAI